MTVAIDFTLLKVGHCAHPECMAMAGGRWKTIRFPALVALLVHPVAGPILFDTGYGEAFFAATRPFPERFYRWITPPTIVPDETLRVQLARRGLAPGDVRHVVLSHLHADHVAGIGEFPEAQLYATRTEVESMHGRSRFDRLRHGFLPALMPDDFPHRVRFVDDLPRLALPPSMHPFGEGFDLLGDGSLVGVPLAGHTAGQLGLSFRATTGRDVFLVADACWTLGALEQERAPTWIASQLFDDRQRYLETFGRLRALLAHRDDLLMVPSHCESTWLACCDARR